MKQFIMATAIGFSLVLSGMANASYRHYPESIEKNQMKYKSNRSLYHMNMSKYKSDRKVYHHDYAIKRHQKERIMLPNVHYYAKRRWHGRYHNYEIFPGLNFHSYRLHWQWAHGGYIPHGALISGYSHGHPYYVCRAKVNNMVMPGKLYAGRGCHVHYKGRWYVRGQYNVLVR